ncbi:MAG: hypothetical protein D6762_06805 [Candidatus Neomarinimicrobiota bacterium]|nr:MAG: hypothetical protein D6762_06805 [Candidatus Neomarinimicrobiota bacterium]
MALFYKELKKLRENSDIKLEEIQNRTKIDLRFLEAFENGQFDLLPYTYIRLFFRAYVTEIGGDPVQALNDLDHYLNRKPATEPSKPAASDKTPKTPEKLSDGFKPQSPVLKRSNLIKAGILIVFWVFALLVIRKITYESSDAAITDGGQHVLIDHLVTDEELLNNYVVYNSSEITHSAVPPFSLRIASKQLLSYRIVADSTRHDTISMASGDSKSFLFSHQAEVVLNHSQGVDVYLNGVRLKEFISQEYPVRISISDTPPVIQYTYYTLFKDGH